MLDLVLHYILGAEQTVAPTLVLKHLGSVLVVLLVVTKVVWIQIFWLFRGLWYTWQ